MKAKSPVLRDTVPAKKPVPLRTKEQRHAARVADAVERLRAALVQRAFVVARKERCSDVFAATSPFAASYEARRVSFLDALHTVERAFREVARARKHLDALLLGER